MMHVTTDQLHTRPPRTRGSDEFVARLDSGGLGAPRYVIAQSSDGRRPDAIVLEYGRTADGADRCTRVWTRRIRPQGSTDYRLSADTSSTGYVTA